MERKLSDLAITDFAGLRILCFDRLWQEPLATFTEAESEALGDLFAHYTKAWQRANFSAETGTPDWRENPGYRVFIRDFEDLPLEVPKWALLAGWLAPESVALAAPEFIAHAAKLALANQLAGYQPVPS